MKQPRLRQNIQPDLSKAKQLSCPRCKYQIFDEKFVVMEISALAPVNPGKIEKIPVMVCVTCKMVLSNKKPEGKETIQ